LQVARLPAAQKTWPFSFERGKAQKRAFVFFPSFFPHFPKFNLQYGGETRMMLFRLVPLVLDNDRRYGTCKGRLPATELSRKTHQPPPEVQSQMQPGGSLHPGTRAFHPPVASSGGRTSGTCAGSPRHFSMHSWISCPNSFAAGDVGGFCSLGWYLLAPDRTTSFLRRLTCE